MNKEQKDVNEKIVDLMLMHQLDESKHFIDFYQNQLNFYNDMYHSHLEIEPWKIFKKRHELWEKQRRQYFDKITDIEDTFGKELMEYEKLLDLLHKDEKKGKKKKDKSN